MGTMTDETPAPKKPRTTKRAETPFERAVASASTEPDPTPVEASEPVAEEVVVEERVTETAPEPTAEPTPAATVGAQPQVIYVTQPPPPPRRGNRGFGVLIALLSTVVFGVLFILAGALIQYAVNGFFDYDSLRDIRVYIPVILFAIGFILLVLITNRANWWAYIVGSILVGLFVYFGTVGLRMLTDGVIQAPDQASELFALQLVNPSTILAALLAREIAMWVGAAISRRGRALKVRNAEARAAYERDLEQKRMERERFTGEPA